jgi:hypothetical protein
MYGIQTHAKCTFPQGATFVFRTILAPYLAQHEGEIDSYLLRLNSSILALVQQKLGQLLAIVLPSMQMQQQQEQNAQQPVPPANYAAGAVLGLLQQYGPSLLGGGAHAGTPSGTASGYELRPDMARSRSSASGPSFPVPQIPE